MRMARALLTLLAVLCAVGGRVWARAPGGDRVRTSHPHPHPVLYVPRDRLANATLAANASMTNTIQEMGGGRWGGGGGAAATGAWKRAMWQEMQAVLVREGAAATAKGAAGLPGGVECCPAVLEMIEPEGGRNPQGLYVELFKSETTRQRFYDLSCHKDFLNKPCRFIDHRLFNSSRCVQQYSYSYALVRDAQASTVPPPPPPPHRHARHEHGHAARPHDAAAAADGWSLEYIRVRAGCSCEIVKERKKRPERHKHKRLKNKRTFSDDDDT